MAATDALDRSAVYRETRERVTELVRDLDPAAAVTIVPACPSWRVKDVVAHVTGVCADIVSGKLEGVATEPWTQAQVDARKEVPIAEIVQEWADVAGKVEGMLGAFPPAAASQLVFDLVTHEHDLRGALRAPGARDSDAVAIGVEFAAGGLIGTAKARGLPPLKVSAGAFALGEDGGATLTAEPFDLLRACSGRRTADEIRALPWRGDPEVYLPAFEFGPFSLPSGPVPD